MEDLSIAMATPRLKRHYSIVAHGPDTVELRYGVWNPVALTLTDEAASGHLLRILRRLDGHYSAEDIAAAEGIPQSAVNSVLERLSELNALETAATHALDHFLEQISPNLRVHERRPGPRPREVVLLGDRRLSEEIARILQSSALHEEFCVRPADTVLKSLLLECDALSMSDSLAFEERVEPFAQWTEKLVVFSVATVNPLEMRGFNRISLRFRIPWIHAAVDGPVLLIGPTFIPFRSACFECLEARVLRNMRDGAAYQRYKESLADGRISGAGAPLEAIVGSMLASMTAFESANFSLTGAAFTVGKLLSVDLPTLEFAFNEVLRVPGCPACSPAAERDDRELYFDARTLGSDSSRPARETQE